MAPILSRIVRNRLAICAWDRLLMSLFTICSDGSLPKRRVARRAGIKVSFACGCTDWLLPAAADGRVF